MWAVYDTEDNCWIGDGPGPQEFEDEIRCRIAAEVWEAQAFGVRKGRFKPRQVPADASWHKKDEIAVREDLRDTLKVINMMENDKL